MLTATGRLGACWASASRLCRCNSFFEEELASRLQFVSGQQVLFSFWVPCRGVVWSLLCFFLRLVPHDGDGLRELRLPM